MIRRIMILTEAGSKADYEYPFECNPDGVTDCKNVQNVGIFLKYVEQNG